jgi:hypothetical protein
MKLNKVKDITQSSNMDKEESIHLAFLKELHSPHKLIDNIKTKIYALNLEATFIPVTINDEAYDTCYVCSVYTAFISYAHSELVKIKSKFLRLLLSKVIHVFRYIFIKIGIDRVISHNNFLLSTNLYPKLDIDTQEFTDYLNKLQNEFPNHAFIFRSLNQQSNESLMQQLKILGFLFYPSRQVYIFDRKRHDFRKQKNFQTDLKLLRRQKIYTFVTHDEIKQDDYPRIVELYNKLYIEKYSKYNPQFNETYIELSHKTKLIEYWALRNKNGVLDAVIGCYDRNGLTTAPIVGYDTVLPQTLGLYRMLMAYCIDRADTNNLVLNLSSGASHFKILRGGIPEIEYSALYIKHLKPLPIFVWRFLLYLLKYLAVPIMKYYKL